MTTPAKIVANRLNSLLSTGPRTAAGKLAVARNAVRHGIFAALPVVPGESADEWEEHRAGVVASLDAVGPLEVALAERAAHLLWRLRRAARYEEAVVTADMEDAGLPPRGVPALSDGFPLFSPTESQLVWAEQELRRAREDLAGVAPEAHLLRRLPDLDDLGPLPAATVVAVLYAAHRLAEECLVPRFRFDQPHSQPFLTGIGCPAGVKAEEVTWTRGLLLAGLGYYAAAAGRDPADFRAEVQGALDAKRAGFARELTRREAEAAALVRRAESERQRAADAALLPPDQVTDRVMKYEKHLHGLLTSTLHELERLQARRAGAAVLPPAVADLHVHLTGGTD